jgi:hypothetical protein
VARWAFRVDGAETGSNAGADWSLRSYNDAGTFVRTPLAVTRSTGEKSLLSEASLTAGTNTFTGTYQIGGATYAAGLTMIGGNPHGAEHNNFTLANAGNLTFANSIYLGAQSNVLRLQGNNSGTVTMQAASPGIRTAAGTLNQVQYNTTTGAALTYTHVSVMQALGIYRLFAAGSLTVTNGYGLIINDLNEYGYAGTGAGALIITNRWGIYQDSTTDVNYLGGTTLVGTTTNAGYKFDINGTLRTVNSANFATTSGNVSIRTTLSNWSAATPALQILNASLYGFSTTENGLSQNAFYDGAWKYISNGFATSIQQTGGTIQLLNAPSDVANAAITWAIRVQLKNSGNFLIGDTTDTGERLQVSGNARVFSTGATTVKIDATGATGNATINFTGPNNYPAIINYGTNMGGLLIQGSGTTLYNFATDGNFTIGNAGVPGFPTNTVTIKSGTAPSSSSVDTFTMYAADITAGNAAAHFRTENGNVIKLYQETTGVAAATFAANTGTAVNDASTFDGYTLNQVIKALRNLGILA